VTDEDFAAFVEAQSPALLGLAHALTGNRHDAWDLLQETLVRVGDRWRRIDQPAAYARTVMTRLNIDRVRRLRRELLSARHREEQGALELTSAAQAWLPEALATLTPRQRTALALRYVEDLDVRAIAARMGCSEGTVKSQLSRGIARLKEQAARPEPTELTALVDRLNR
jgi:RNA polymerase sigma-70 factor (sigma-E family)